MSIQPQHCNFCWIAKIRQSATFLMSISRSQLREQICQTSKSDRQEWQSLEVLNGTNISILKFICGILNRGMANSFWNHIIQISSRQIDFQDIYTNLWKVKIFSGNIYSFKIKYIFLRDSYVCPRWIFIFDSDQEQINSACSGLILYSW